jgi:heme/copper-type cytochrome/quinol oxidase subunit 2
MQSNTARAVVGIGTIAVIVVLFIVLSDGDDNKKSSAPATTATATTTGGERTATTPKPARPKPPTIVVRGGTPVGGVKRLDLEKGERVRFVVRSDVADEVHVHGYDIKKDVPAGGRVSFSFRADLEGVFEVELEGRKQQIAELRVNP